MLNFRTYTRRFATPLWKWYVSGFLVLILVNYITLEVPQLAKQIVNALTGSGEIKGAANTALLIVALGALMTLTRALSRILIFWPGRQLETTTKSYLFDRVLRLPHEFMARYGMGDLISRLSNDVGQIRAFYAFGLLQVLNVSLLLTFIIWRMATVHLTLTLLALVPLAAMMLVTRYAMPKMHFYSKTNQEAVGSLTSKVTEAFVNVHVIQTNAAVDSFTERAEKENELVYTTNIKLVILRTLIFPLMPTLAAFSQLLVLFYGGREAIMNRLSVGDILAFNIYIGLLTFPLTALGIIIAVYQRAKTAIERIGEIDEAPLETAHPARIEIKPAQQQAIDSQLLLKLNALSFHMAERGQEEHATRFALQNIDLSLKPGQKIGLFGPIGSGKTTIFNLISRLYEPPAGMIFFKGQDVLTFEPPALRREIGYGLQSVHLFSESIRENLLFGIEAPVSEAELRFACEKAQIIGEIEAFQQGFATQIGEKGVRLSGGQKQRLALARLFLRKPALLLLDDVLSAVDHTTERRLLDAIHELGCAMMIASHRGSALQRCDEILVLEAGRIVDRGTFAELVPHQPELALDL